MLSLPLNNFRQWLKQSEHPFARWLLPKVKALRLFQLPAPKWLWSPLYGGYRALANLFSTLFRVLWWTPLFKGRIKQGGDQLFLFGGLPYISGPVQIELGSQCRISGHTTFSGRTAAAEPPRLKVGSNVDIGWQTTIAVGRQVVLGDNVRIAGRTLLAGYPGHPLDPAARAAGASETEDQVGDIILEDDVWLATGVSVMAGVRIGQGTVVAAGSVVTRDLPPMVLAGGVPARVIRPITPTDTGV